LRSKTNLPLIAFEEEDFYEYFPGNWVTVDLFQQSFARLFANYSRNWRDNALKAVANSKGESVHYLTDEEFVEEYREPPWVVVNRTFEASNLDFTINEPRRYQDHPYEPILTDRIRGNRVKFADLSSGEKILMSFSLCLYYAQEDRQIIDYPRILLLDEIDAPLHPSMAKSLLRTIREELVGRYGIKVILTTHSPSTVALAEESSIYVMFKTAENRLKKTTKDKALAILTAGVPTLSIDYENRRQVFVESSYDVSFYEKIYEKLKDKASANHLIPEISLDFISSGLSRKGGSCAQVKKIVNTLYRCGNKNVYGIIDWDLKNQGNPRIKILGKNKRYSIENYILDPLLVAAFLLREKWINRLSLGLNKDEVYTDLRNFDNARLQIVANFIVDKVRNHISPLSEGTQVSCTYAGGQLIQIPEWFLQIQGHQLEKILKEIFKELKRFTKEFELKNEITRKIVDDIPSLISKDLILLFQEIQDVGNV
jgi:AAA domain, putative AbiEii toxin, Type IV TA system